MVERGVRGLPVAAIYCGPPIDEDEETEMRLRAHLAAALECETSQVVYRPRRSSDKIEVRIAPDRMRFLLEQKTTKTMGKVRRLIRGVLSRARVGFSCTRAVVSEMKTRVVVDSSTPDPSQGLGYSNKDAAGAWI